MKGTSVDIIDLQLCSSLKQDGVYKRGASWYGPPLIFDTVIESAINMHLDDGMIIKLNQCSRSIYYYKTTNMENNNTDNQVTDDYFFNTVQGNKSYFNKR